MSSNEFICIGKIVGVFGIKGELKVYTESDFIDHRFRVGASIILKHKKETKTLAITSMRIHKNRILIQVDNLNDINLVEKYVGYDIYATNDDMPALEHGEYYLDNLIGLDVADEDKHYIGKVLDFIEVPQGYIMEVKTKNDKLLIPFVHEYIVDILEDKIIIKVIELWQ